MAPFPRILGPWRSGHTPCTPTAIRRPPRRSPSSLNPERRRRRLALLGQAELHLRGSERLPALRRPAAQRGDRPERRLRGGERRGGTELPVRGDLGHRRGDGREPGAVAGASPHRSDATAVASALYRVPIRKCRSGPPQYSGGSMKRLLTSAGITNASIHAALIDLLGKPIAESGALSIPTASYGHAPGGVGGRGAFADGQEPRCPEGHWKLLTPSAKAT